ncbi:histamine N-methyltransferase-like [Amphiura filiformis]|uniref:histamine N-methyltransferase-like n=1 Tax=Amphiura filiformis TaxID=82378 RepID=UPI003B2282FE
MAFKHTKLPESYYQRLDHYWLGLATYWQHSNRFEILPNWIETNFESEVVKILSERLRDGDTIGDQSLQVLGVGTGDGYQEMVQMKILKSNFSQISATVIEPSTEQITKYQHAVAKSCDLGGVDYIWQNQTFQDYMRSPGAKQKYHFISIVDVMYFMGDAEECLRNLLEPGGMIFMIVQTEHTGVGNLVKTFPHLAVEEQIPRSSESGVAKRNYLINSAVVKTALTKLQFTYTQSAFLEIADLTYCFTHAGTPVARLLLDMITTKKHFKESVSDEVFNQVMEYLKRNTRIEKSDQGDDVYYFDTECEVLLISK